MRLAAVNDKIFDELVNSNDKIVYNLFTQIKNDPSAFIVTDDRTYIFTQDSRRTPNWVFLKDIPDDKTTEELIALISGMVRLNPLLRVNGNEEHLRPILDEVSARSGVPYKEEIPMEVFFCNKLSHLERCGQMIVPKEMHRERLKEIISSMSRDDDGMILGADDSEKYISSMVHSGAFYLWENDKIVSIAKVANKGDGYARINTIFTDIEERGHGYTKMLVHSVSEKLLSEGFIPVIYADKRNKNKSIAYQEVGFQKAGNITQFAFVQKL